MLVLLHGHNHIDLDRKNRQIHVHHHSRIRIRQDPQVLWQWADHHKAGMMVMERYRAQMALAFQRYEELCMQHIAGLLLVIEKVYVDVKSSLAETMNCIDPGLVVRPAAEAGKWEPEADYYKDFVQDEEIGEAGDELVVVDQVGGLQVVVDRLLDIDCQYSYRGSGPAVNLAHMTAVAVGHCTEAASLLEAEVDPSIALVVVDLLEAVDNQIAGHMAGRILLDHRMESGACRYHIVLDSEQAAVLVVPTGSLAIVVGCTGSALEDLAEWIDSPATDHIAPELAVQEL